MKYLTRSYVEWLGLQKFPMLKRVHTATFVSVYAMKPTIDVSYIRGVCFDGFVYAEEEDGLAFVRTEGVCI